MCIDCKLRDFSSSLCLHDLVLEMNSDKLVSSPKKEISLITYCHVDPNS